MINPLVRILRDATLARRPTTMLPYEELSLIPGGESLEPGAEPETTFQTADDEYRAVGIAILSGDNIILSRQNNYDVEVIEVTICPTAACNVQIRTANGQAVSALWPLAAGEKWSAPGIIISRSFDLILNLSIATSTPFEVRWKPCYGRM